MALHPVGGEGGGVEADAAGPQGGGGGAGEEGVVRHLLGLDGSLHLQCEVCSNPLSATVDLSVDLLDGAVVAGGHQVEVQLARHQHAAGGQVQQPQPQPGGSQLPC